MSGEGILHAQRWPRRKPFAADEPIVKVGKKHAGHLLDGVEHNATPEAP